MTRLVAVVLAILAAALVAAAALRRRVPAYPDWWSYVEGDDGLEPDPYLERLR